MFTDSNKKFGPNRDPQLGAGRIQLRQNQGQGPEEVDRNGRDYPVRSSEQKFGKNVAQKHPR